MQAYGIVLISEVVAFWPLTDLNKDPIKPLPKSLKQRDGQTFARLSRKTTNKIGTYQGKPLLVEGQIDLSASALSISRYTMVDAILTYERYTERVRKGVLVRAYGCDEYKIDLVGDQYWIRSRNKNVTYYNGDGPIVAHASFPALFDSCRYGGWLTNQAVMPIGPIDYYTPRYGDFYPDAGVILTEFAHASIYGFFFDQNITRCTQQAYTVAAASLPEVASNAIASSLEAVALLATLLRGKSSNAKAVSKSLGDAWLAYRYAYTTTKLDVEEYVKYINRIKTLSTDLAHQEVTARGVFTHNGWTYRCTLVLRVQDLLPDKIRDKLDGLGFKLSALNAWDMIPYSFIVDWFLPIADTLEAFEGHKEAMKLEPVECWFSIESPGGKHYLRTPGAWQSAVPVLRDHQVSDQTFWFRVADTISLLWK